MIENELDNGPQEPPVESAKKNNTRTLVKRTLAIAGLALVVYFLYSIVHLFVSPDRNIQQIWTARHSQNTGCQNQPWYAVLQQNHQTTLPRPGVGNR